MRFLVDAQLPKLLSAFFTDAGHDSIHACELPEGNRTTDRQLAAVADGHDRIVVTKDGDFRDAHVLRGIPRRLLVVATGNITNNELLALFEANLALVVEAFGHAGLVEMSSTSLVIHDDHVISSSGND